MCGIFSILNVCHTNKSIGDDFNKGSGRGPEFSSFKCIENVNCIMGFHRLAINGLDDISNQPFNIDNIMCICNGEIYNHTTLYHHMKDVKIETNSDCEVIIHLYKKYGFKHTVRMLDGVFAFVLIDMRNINNIKAYITRDPHGVRPLYEMKSENQYWFASEMKMMTNNYNKLNESQNKLRQFSPGTYSKFKLNENKSWNKTKSVKYCYLPFSSIERNICLERIHGDIRRMFYAAVKKRVENSERPIACLLSGGLDSSIVSSIVARELGFMGKQLETYSIGMEGGEDLKYAQMVADHIGSKHTTITYSADVFLNAIPEVIYAIESYDTTTVRASVGNYLVAKYIKEHSDAKVIFNGDGSDELMGGYLYFHYCPDSIAFDGECKRLLSNIHYFDVLRSDRTISCHGLEARTPFLDRGWVEHYLSLNPIIRNHVIHGKQEKYLFRDAFDHPFDFMENGKIVKKNLLPNEVLRRQKEAFSDGVSSKVKSWYEIIQEKFQDDTIWENEVGKNNPTFDVSKSREDNYYIHIFNKYYNFEKSKHLIPYYWMPRFIEARDSSARTLNVHEKNK